MPGQFDLQPSFPIAGVADLIANRPYKEAQMRQQQQQQLVQGLQQFGEGVNSLVQKRNSMAQALTLGKNLGMAPEQVQGLDPSQVIQSYVAQKGNVDMNLLMTMLHPNAGTPNATTTVSAPGGQVPVASTGGPVLASLETPAPPQPAGQAAPQAATDQPAAPSMPVPIAAPPTKPPTVNKATMDAMMKIAALNKVEPVVTRAQAEAAGGVRHGTHILPDPKSSFDVGVKEEQFYQREWDKLLKESDPLNASSRTPLGMASRATFQANRALKTLMNPMVTNQEAGNAMADMAGIYQNGSPTQFGMSHQEYTTAYAKIQNAIQSFTGKPTDALPNDIKNRLISDLKDMKNTNSALLKQRLDMTEKSKKAVISHFPGEWKEYRDILEGNHDQYNGLPSSTDQHTEAIKWAQANPNDPRSAAILKKAMDATQGAGGSIGL